MTEDQMTRPSSPRSRRADAERNIAAILEAARRLLPDRPGVSMGQIASEAGVHRATVHRHFASRDELVAAVRAQAMEDSMRAVAAVLDDPPVGAAAQLEALTTAMLASAGTYRLYRFTTWLDERTQARSEEFGARMVPILEAGRQEGELRTDMSADQLLVAYGGLVMAALPEISEGRMTAAEGGAFVRRMLSSAT
jgi:AcrR family transcriptional regulator